MAHKNLLKGFKRPSKITFEHIDLSNNYGKFSAEPFERGYGTTIGNSLRRVLLSSIEGAAINAIRIEGVQHEFSTIDGVYEDVTKIILNLKKLRIKYEEEMPKVLHISKEGKGTLTGADFSIDSDITILNPDLVIATLDNDGKIDMEVQIEKGKGYVPAEFSEKNSDVIGVIAIDAIYSPVMKVNVTVNDTRVGQRTDYDKLILEIWTDGSVRPDDALAQASKILKDHLSIFINFEEEMEEETEEVDEGVEKMKSLLSRSIDDMEFSVRTYNALKTLDISTLEQLVRKAEDELYKSKHTSEQVVAEIKQKLEAKNLNLGLKE